MKSDIGYLFTFMFPLFLHRENIDLSSMWISKPFKHISEGFDSSLIFFPHFCWFLNAFYQFDKINEMNVMNDVNG